MEKEGIKQHFCINCGSELTIDNWYDSSKERRYYICKECVRKRNNKYKRDNRSVIRLSIRRYYHRTRSENNEYGWSKATYHSHKKYYNVKFTVDELYELANKVRTCVYCGREMKYDRSDKYTAASLDRTNNETDLSLKDVQIICLRCNQMKNNQTEKEFIEMVKNIYERWVK